MFSARCIILILLTTKVARPVTAGTSEPWTLGRPNQCENDDDTFVDFEGGIEGTQIQTTNPGFSFVNTGGLDWLFADIRTDSYNVNEYNSGTFATNGNFFAWLGPSGSVGDIIFKGTAATYFSALVSIGSSSLTFEAYDADNNLVDTAVAPENADGTGKLTRLTVSNTDGISKVKVFDSGNFWLIDDVCTDAKLPCELLEGRSSGPSSERIDIVFLKDKDYANSDQDFLDAVNDQIDKRLFAKSPVAGEEAKFNFYIAPTITMADSDDAPGQKCGLNTIPSDFFSDLCPFADAVAILHSETYGDCSWNGVFSTEDDIVRSFIHEVGHAAFGLRDEYASACPTLRSSTENIYGSEAECLADIANNAPDAGLTCFEFTTACDDPQLWKIDDGIRTIMDDGTHWADGWSQSSQWRITEKLSGLSSSSPPGSEPEKSIIATINVDDGGLSLVDVAYRVSPPRQYVGSDDTMTVSVYAAGGALLTSFGVGNPRRVSFEAGPDGAPGFDVEVASVEDFSISVPYFHNAVEIVVTEGAASLSVDISAFQGPPPPKRGGGAIGDPHIKRWNQKSFDFHGECDLVLLHSDHVNGDKELDLHIRTTIQHSYSSIEQAALRVGDFVLEMDSGNFYLNGGEAFGDDELPFTTAEFTISKPAYSKEKKHRRVYEISLNDGSVIFVRKTKRFISVTVDGSAADFARATGLLGDFHTGAPKGRDGRIIHNDWEKYGQEWQVLEDEPKLFMTVREPQLPHAPCKMPPVSAQVQRRRRLRDAKEGTYSPEIYAMAQKACVNADEVDVCIDDVVSTGDIAFADMW